MKTQFNRLFNFLLIFALTFGMNVQVQAMPMDPVDETKVPHYFGPNPNWANSPFTLPDAQVVITGNGTGATAEATVGANGVVTDIVITNPGHNYSNARVDILGSGTGATADVTIVKKGAVVAVTVDLAGSGYTAPVVNFSGNGAAAATAYGGVENNILLISGGSGYQFPTVDFDLPDGPNGVQAQGHAEMDLNGTITTVVVDNPGSGYSTAPNVVIRDGTIFDPINNGGMGASASATLSIQEIALDAFGSGYNQVPTVSITDPTGLGATATAALDNGVISAITLKRPGSGYVTGGGIRKFVDTLPGLGPTAANNLGQYIPVAVPDTTTFPGTDYYEIAVVDYVEKMHSDLPATKLRGYVQLETSNITGIHYDLRGGKLGVDKPHYLGPTIVAQRDRAVRITFFNLLPNGAAGDLFLPVDTTIMGSGMGPAEMMMDPMDEGTVMDEVRNPMCTDKNMDPMMREHCFTENRATLHLHGGNTPWISDGTPHQWITPAGEGATWPQGVSVVNVPDMEGVAGVPNCSAPDDGCQTFYYTNQQSARLMFYHDHSWGITRLNVYAGEAAGYLITDETEAKLTAAGGALDGLGLGIPLIIQDKTFVPQDAQMYNQYDANGNLVSYGQDPTWDAERWGGYGNLWYHHVYMPAQNPGAPGGMSAFGRWMYSPWFWPPQQAKYPPIANPYYDPACDLDIPATWQYQEDPFCEPQLIPSTPLISAGMEQFNDTAMVNGTAYPTMTVEPKTYRFRILNAANDRFFNFQWYVGDPTTASTGLNANGDVIGATEVALNPAELAAAQLDPVVFATPVQGAATAGPDWIQIANEGGFLPAPVVIDGQQFTTWIEDPTRFDNGLVDQHSLLLAPAERADVVVDFSQFAGKTLILYNDAPAAFPARIPSYDYYTGAPDLRPVGAPPILPGYGPNTRTIMQIKVAPAAPAPAFNLTKLRSAFSHKADGSGVFESGQHPVIVGQSAYNSAYGTAFASSGWCNAPGSTSTRCDGFARINEQGGDMFGFNTLLTGTSAKLQVKIEPKAIQDETSESNFDEFGRMSAVLGVEIVPAMPGVANTVLYPYMGSITEIIDTTNLPKADMKVTPIASGDDGTQIWKITHNGVDTHPIHVHAYDVQIINRVTWDNIIKPPDPTELGWKETVRVSPLEDTYFALRPVIPTLPFDFPNSVRLLSPMMADDAPIDLSSVKDGLGLPLSAFAPNGEPIDVYNHYVNFGAEYVYHCHILSHEEMDMMRPVILAFPPKAPSGLAFDASTGALSWTDNSLSETAFVVEQSSDGGTSWTVAGKVVRQLLDPNTTGDALSVIVDVWNEGDQFRVVAQNTVGDTWDYADPNLNEIPVGSYAFPVVTTEAISEVFTIGTPPDAPTGLTATLEAGPQVSLAWTDVATTETGYVVQRSVNGGAFSDLATLGADTVSYIDLAVSAGDSYAYQVAAFNGSGRSAYAFSNSVSVFTPAPPSNLTATLEVGPQISLAWTDNSTDETGFIVERSDNGGAFVQITDLAVPDTMAYLDTSVMAGNTYAYRVAAYNLAGASVYAVSNDVLIPGVVPNAPSDLSATLEDVPLIHLAWADNSADETGFVIERSTDGINFSLLATVAADTIVYDDLAIFGGVTYTYRVAAVSANGSSGFAVSKSVLVPPDATAPAAPSSLAASNVTQTTLTLTWTDNSNNEAGFTIQRATNSAFTSGLVSINVGADVTSYNDSGLTKKTKYFYRVLAFNNFNNGAGPFPWSPILNVTTKK